MLQLIDDNYNQFELDLFMQRATSNQPVPLDKPYVSKDLFFFDITDASSDEIKEITIEQLKKGRAFAFEGADSANVYLSGKEAIVAVYRAK